MSETLDELREELAEYQREKEWAGPMDCMEVFHRALDIAIADCKRRIDERVKILELQTNQKADYFLGRPLGEYLVELARHTAATKGEKDGK